MRSFVQTTIIAMLMIHGLFVGVQGVSPVYANPLSDSLTKTAQNSKLGAENNNQSIAQRFKDTPAVYIGRVLGVALSMLGVVFFFLVFYAGILWMTAHGKSDQIDKAQDILINASIGLIIVLGSYAIVRTVFQSIEGGGTPAIQNVAPQAQSDAACLEKGAGFACQNIANCGVEGATVEAQRRNCSGPNCALNLCSGGNEIVCCAPVPAQAQRCEYESWDACFEACTEEFEEDLENFDLCEDDCVQTCL